MHYILQYIQNIFNFKYPLIMNINNNLYVIKYKKWVFFIGIM